MLILNQTHRHDPSRSRLIRSAYEKALVSRFLRLKKEIRLSVIDHDAFGLQPEKLILFQAVPARAFNFFSDASKVSAFLDWLQTEVDTEILEIAGKDNQGRVTSHSGFQNKYVRAAYERAVTQAYSLLARAGVELPLAPFDSISTFPIHVDTLELLYTRNFIALQGITAALVQGIMRVLTEGLTQGLKPSSLVRSLNAVVDKIGVVRARVLAQSETLYTHNLAHLRIYESMGIDAIMVAGEGKRVEGARVRCECSSLTGKVFTLAEAKKIRLPLHVMCLCSFQPAIEAIRKAQERQRRRVAA